jgi:hypothetical protein
MIHRPLPTVAMQKVEGSSPFSRFQGTLQPSIGRQTGMRGRIAQIDLLKQAILAPDARIG